MLRPATARSRLRDAAAADRTLVERMSRGDVSRPAGTLPQHHVRNGVRGAGRSGASRRNHCRRVRRGPPHGGRVSPLTRHRVRLADPPHPTLHRRPTADPPTADLATAAPPNSNPPREVPTLEVDWGLHEEDD